MLNSNVIILMLPDATICFDKGCLIFSNFIRLVSILATAALPIRLKVGKKKLNILICNWVSLLMNEV